MSGFDISDVNLSGIESLIKERDGLRTALNRKQAVVDAAKALRKVAQGTMILLGPTGLKFTAALDEYEANK